MDTISERMRKATLLAKKELRKRNLIEDKRSIVAEEIISEFEPVDLYFSSRIPTRETHDYLSPKVSDRKGNQTKNSSTPPFKTGNFTTKNQSVSPKPKPNTSPYINPGKVVPISRNEEPHCILIIKFRLC
jgi:hypothetical protein